MPTRINNDINEAVCGESKKADKKKENDVADNVKANRNPSTVPKLALLNNPA
jgi:hypothetical protein